MSHLHPNGNPPIPIVADGRETRAPVLEALRSMAAFDVSVRRLTVGDYLVDNRLLFERKTLADLVVSIQSGRLFKQALRLVEAGEGRRPALILEGTTSTLHKSGM